MIIEPFRGADIPLFLKLATEAGWVAETWEFEFLLQEFPQGCFAARSSDGAPIGFVTSLRHDRSGWIGNLLVTAQHRGKGVGERLFCCAHDALRNSGAQTVWLTASQQGKSLYEKHGFRTVDTILRWVGTGRQRHATHGGNGCGEASNSSVSSIDCLAWGGRRDALLAATVARGELNLIDSGFCVIQPCNGACQIGPFAAFDSTTAEQLFDSALRTIPFGTKIYLDAPAANRHALRMFNRRRMAIAGSSALMYAGLCPEYRPELIYGLATMGSCG
jgi:ribosomal protein S18 acetylase RimI-like enzyme